MRSAGVLLNGLYSGSAQATDGDYSVGREILRPRRHTPLLQGDTRNLPLSNLFQTLALNQQEGVLSIYYRKVERSIAIRGNDVFIICERPFSSSLLPEILTRLDMLTASEYQNVITTVTEPRSPGDILTERHLVTEDQVYGPVREHMFERLFETFEWVGARYKFEVKPVDENRLIFADPHYEPSMALPVNSVLMEVARREDEWMRIRQNITEVHQIYKLAPGAEAFESADGLDPERLRRLLSQLDGERTLQEILNESEVPEFFVFSTLRALIDKSLVSTLALEEKRDLSERLRNKFQLDRVAEVYKSILAEDPSQVDVRKKLVLFLERKKADPAELVEHYRQLAQEARKNGNDDSELEQLEKIRAAIPNDPEALGELARLALETGRDRDWVRNLGAYVDAAQKAKAYRQGAERLLQFSEVKPDDVTLLNEAANFLFQDGNKEQASGLYKRAATHYESKGDLVNLKRVVSRLELCNPEQENPWKSTVDPVQPKRPRRERNPLKILALGSVAVMIVGVCCFGAFEIMAWSARAEAGTKARGFATLGELPRAQETLLSFRSEYARSVFSSSTDALEREIELIAERVASGVPGTGEPMIKDPPTTTEVDSAPRDAEALLSKAAAHTQRGEYKAALDLYEQVDPSLLSGTVANSVITERNRLSRYLEEATAMAAAIALSEKRGDYETAGRQCKKLLYDYSFSPETRALKVPLLVKTSPRNATVVAQNVIVHGPPHILHARPSESLVIKVSAKYFKPVVITVDPLENSTITVLLQREVERVIGLDSTAEAGPAATNETVFVGTRSGRVFAYSLADGSETWARALEELGDVFGQIRRYENDILFLGTEGAVYRMTATGEQVFRDKLPSGIGYPSSPISAPDSHGRVFVTTRRGYAAAYDVDSGKILWDRSLSNSSLSAPTVNGNRVAITDPQGRVYCLECDTGEVAWKTDLDGQIPLPPVWAGDRLLVTTLDNEIHALSMNSGRTVWKRPLPDSVRVLPVVTDDSYFVITQTGVLIRGSLDTGEAKYRERQGGRYTLAGLACDSDSVYAVDDEGIASAFALSDGTRQWIYSTSSKPGSTPVVHGGRLILTAIDKGLHVLRLDQERESKR